MKKNAWWIALGLIALAAGCQAPMKTLVSMEGETIAPTSAFTVQERGTYYLYSSKDEHSPVYSIDLKKGDELGFRIKNGRGIAYARDTIVQLKEFDEKVNYYWKMEAKENK